MTLLSPTETIILGIVAEQPTHGYDINKVLEIRNVRKWADIGFSSIYYVLDKLESKKLVTSDTSSGKEQKKYSITNLGKSTLTGQSASFIANRYPAYTHLMTGLAASGSLRYDELLSNLKERLKLLQSDLVNLKIAQERSGSVNNQARMLFELSIALLKAEISWIKKEIERNMP